MIVVDREKILELAGRGLSLSEAARELHMTPYQLRSRAKLFDLPYSSNRWKRKCATRIVLPEATTRRLCKEARRRGVGTSTLISALLIHLAHDDLYSAILDR